MSQQIKRLLQSNVSRDNIIWVNFSDERLHGLKCNELGLILEAFYTLRPENKDPLYCFFDEMQQIQGWELFVDRIMRDEGVSVYITGSSAKMLSKEIATQMRGRSLSWEVFPFSFKEFLDFKQFNPGKGLSTRETAQLKNLFSEYWNFGGFPEVLDFDPVGIRETHQDYFKTVLFRDIVERHDVGSTKILADLSHWLIANIGSLYSINRLHGYLQSLSHKISHTLVAHYLAWLEDAFFFFSIPIFDASVARTNRNPKKIYCIDHALVRSVSSGTLSNQGHLLENLIFIALRRLSSNIYYYKTKTDEEVDFIVLMPDKTRWLIQVCETLHNPDTRKRELKALTTAMKELQLDKATIVTRHEEETIAVDAGQIHITPHLALLIRDT